MRTTSIALGLLALVVTLAWSAHAQRPAPPAPEPAPAQLSEGFFVTSVRAE